MNRNIIFAAIGVGFYWGLKWLFGKHNGKASDMPNKVFFWMAIVFAIGLMFGMPYLGTKIPGSFFERSDYKGLFYVNLFPEGQKIKSYRAPAMVSATIEIESDNDYDSHSYSEWRVYRIEFAIIPDGGKITFYESDERLELGQTVTMYDDNNRYWRIELTDIPVRK